MAKDPAFLFYSQDFLTGTGLMNARQKGHYITLLCYQHQNICLSHEDVMLIMGDDYENDWKIVKKKFKQTQEGCYYNERLREESEKRKRYCESRSSNKKGKKKDHSHENHMLEHMENENDNVIANESKEEISAIENFEKRKSEPDNWRLDCSSFLNDRRFKHDFSRTKNIPYEDVHRRIRDFILDLHLQENYMDIKGMKKYFVNSYNKWVENNGRSAKEIRQQPKGFIELPNDIDYEKEMEKWSQQ